MTSVLALTTYGFEIAEIGGTLARHAADGDTVHASVLFSREATRPSISAAAAHLGIDEVTYAHAVTGELDGTEGREVRDRLVELIRRVRPGIALLPDPEHTIADLDPDRRPAAPLTLEALALSARDWRTEELGEECPTVPRLYYYFPAHTVVTVDITTTMTAKLAALGELDYQASYSEQRLRDQIGEEGWAAIAGFAGDGGLLQALETAHALHHGAGGHSGAAFAEAFRPADTITLPKLC
ncbi:hypothetical protein BH23ACT9_BH23ACT9_30710 [soil metagenome]